MPPEISNREPSRFVAGSTVTWKKSLSDFPASDGWVLKYFLRGPSRLDVTCTADGNDFVATIAASDSAKLKTGRYWMQGRVELAGAKHLVTPDMLELEILPGLDAESANVDLRSQAERIVAEIDDLIERSTGGDTFEYEVEGHRKKTYTRTELLEVRRTYQRKVNSERRRKRVAAGGEFFQTIPVALTTVR